MLSFLPLSTYLPTYLPNSEVRLRLASWRLLVLYSSFLEYLTE